MRILFLMNGFMAVGLSGGDRHLFELARAWSADHDVTMIVPEFIRPVLPAGVRVRSYRAPPGRNFLELMATFLWRPWRVWALARTTPAELVVTSSGAFDVGPGLLHRRRFGSRLVAYPFHVAPPRRHESFSTWARASMFLLLQRVAVWCMRRADLLFCCNDLVRQELERRGVPPGIVRVQFPIVQVEEIRRAAAAPGFDGLFIGRIVGAKGVYDVVEIARETGARIGLVGVGPETDAVRAKIVQHGLVDRVKLLGHLSDDEVYGLLKGAKFFVFPSREEGYGIVIAEAIVAGKPVFAYALPHYPEKFGPGIVTAPIGDWRALAVRVKDLLEGRHDEAAMRVAYAQVPIFDRKAAAATEMAEIARACGRPAT